MAWNRWREPSAICSTWLYARRLGLGRRHDADELRFTPGKPLTVTSAAYVSSLLARSWR